MEIKKLISWSKKNYSKLPWRENRSVYSTWISEVMLQQTTVYTVKSRLNDFLEKFPSVSDLADASERRATYCLERSWVLPEGEEFKKAAEYIRDELSGVFLEIFMNCKKSQVLGTYTSSALVAIGMDKKALAVDANLERVLARYYGIETFKGTKLKEELQNKFEAKEILNVKVSSWRDLNEAIMDLGREICQARRADCLLCPIQKNCIARKKVMHFLFPSFHQK